MQIQNSTDQCTRVHLNLIDDLPFGNSRKKRNPIKFDSLKESVGNKGVVQSVVLRPSTTIGGRYELVAGYGRRDASLFHSLEDIPAIIKNLTDAEALEIQMEENLNREDLSLLDEAMAAQELSAFYNGDRDAVASRLCWPRKKVNERLEFMKATPKVREAVDNNQITVGHALLLAPFSANLQDSTLTKIIDEKWTVKYLKERTNNGKQLLKNAKFNTKDCNLCEHNNAHQSGLFELVEHDAACCNLKCFKEKTSSWLEERKAELSEKFGVVLCLHEVNKDDTNTVSETNVGKEQFDGGCIGCDKRIVLIDDHLGRTTGSTIENQCIDKICFHNCKKAFDQSQNPKVETITTEDKTETTKSTVKAKNTSKSATPKKVVEANKKTLRELASNQLLQNEQFIFAMQLASLLRTSSGYKSSFEQLHLSSFEEAVIKASKLEVEQLKSEINNVIIHMAKCNEDSSINFTNLMLKGLSKTNGAKKLATSHWMPTKQNLENYTVDGLMLICNQSGLTKAWEARNTEHFKKASSGKKSDFIEAILKEDFDWSAYAPTSYLELVK